MSLVNTKQYIPVSETGRYYKLAYGVRPTFNDQTNVYESMPYLLVDECDNAGTTLTIKESRHFIIPDGSYTISNDNGIFYIKTSEHHFEFNETNCIYAFGESVTDSYSIYLGIQATKFPTT